MTADENKQTGTSPVAQNQDQDFNFDFLPTADAQENLTETPSSLSSEEVASANDFALDLPEAPVTPVAEEVAQTNDFSFDLPDAPVVEEAAPVVEELTPVMEEVTPVMEETAPVMEETAPVMEEVTPVMEELTPVMEEVAPVMEEVAPVMEEVAPVMEEVAPVMEEAAPVMEEVAPVMEEVAPVMEEVAPVMEEVAPVMEEVTPVTEESAPVMEESTSSLSSDTSPSIGFLLEEDTNASLSADPIVQEPAPIIQESVPVVEEAAPVMEEPAPVMEEPAPIVQEVAPVMEAPVMEEVAPEPAVTNTLDLDAMISQFNNDGASSEGLGGDPFQAMKDTLQATQEPIAQSAPIQETSQLNTQVLQEAPQEVVQPVQIATPEQIIQPAPISVLDQSSALAPETMQIAPQLSPQPQAVPQAPNMPHSGSKKALGFVALLVVLIVLGIIGLIRHPDLFSNLIKSPVQLAVTDDATEQQNTQEHGAAPEQHQQENPDQETTNELPDQEAVSIVEDLVIEEPEFEEFPTELTFPIDDEKDTPGLIGTIDLTEEAAPQQEEAAPQQEETPALTQEVEKTLPEEKSKDPFDAVESVVGAINNDDMLKEEIADYHRRGTELLELGNNTANTNMRRHGAFIQHKTTFFLDTIERGEKIDISKWSSLKEKLDEYLDAKQYE